MRAAILTGPPGVGKTTAALALAHEHRWTVVEMNASDARNQGAIEEVAGRASLSHTLGDRGTYRGAQEGGRTLILLDEADCLTGRPTEESRRAKPVRSLREFLRTRYLTLQALRASWGLAGEGRSDPFESWDDVPATGGRGSWTKLPAAQRDITDWRDSQKTHDASDRGGLGAIARLVRETRQPVVLTVNDIQPLTRYSPVFRSGVRRVDFDPVKSGDLRVLLRRVATQERLTVTAPVFDRIVERAKGDVRAALNDLDAIAPLGTDADVNSLLGGRDSITELGEMAREVIAEPRVYRSVEVSNRTDTTPDDLFLWIEEALGRNPAEPARRAAAFEHLAIADRFLFWARRERVYSLWSYATEVMTGGVGLALSSGTRGQFVPVAFPQYLGAMGRTRATRALRQGLLTKVRTRFHLSRRKGAESFLPLLESIFRERTRAAAQNSLRSEIAHELELTPEEVALLLGVEPDHSSVKATLAAPAARPSAPEKETEPASPPKKPRAKSSRRATPREAGGPVSAPKSPKRKVQRQLAEY